MRGEYENSSIVIDMGGTTTRIGCYADGILQRGTVRFDTPKPAAGGSVRDAHLDRIAAEAGRVRDAIGGGPDRRAGPGGRVAVGVAVGATVDARGRVRNAAMLWHEPCVDFDLAGALAQRMPWADLVVCNDIAAAAWRYRELGRFALVTVSTGVAVKVFDDSLPFDAKLLLDPDGLGGEIGHVLVGDGAGDPRRYRSLGRAAARGDAAARLALARDEVPWCECGNVRDLCSYTSGPAVVRAAAARARAVPGQWLGSKLSVLCDGDPDRITARAIASAAHSGDAFVHRLLHAATRPLAAQILNMSAQLGLRRFVVMGGFARGVGEPWFAALRANLRELLPEGAWFTGWRASDVDGLVEASADSDDSLVGMGRYVTDRQARARELYKPPGESSVVLRHRRPPRCGREQFVARVEFAGICGTDVQILRGERGCEPGVPGHECVARVVDVGADVSGIVPGEVIGVNPNHPRDEHDKLGHNLPGVLRDFAVWDGHLVDREQIVPLPRQARAEWVLMEPLACALRSVRAGMPVPTGAGWAGRRVLVVGAGVMGLLHVLLLRRLGAERVLLANRGARRAEIAVRRGLVPAADCLPLDGRLAETVREATGGQGIDAAFVAVSGTAGAAIVESLWTSLADESIVDMFSGFAPDAVVRLPSGERVAVQPVRRGRYLPVSLPGGGSCRLLGSRGASGQEYRAARDLCVDPAGLNLAPLVSHLVSMEAAPTVLDELATDGCVGGEPALRVVVDLGLTGHVVRPVDGTDLPRLGGS